MELREFILPGDEPSYVFLTDTHIGSAGFDREGFQACVERIRLASDCYWIAGGDYAEYISHKDYRFDPEAFPKDMTIRSLGNIHVNESLDFLDLVAPIQHKCLGLHEGNHDQEIRKQYCFDVVEFLSNKLNVPKLSYTSLLRIKAVGREFILYSTHGGCGKLEYWMNKVVKGWNADVYQKGHTHEMGFMSRPFVSLANGKEDTTAVDRLFIVGGCWKKAYQTGSASYEERREYPPNPIGNYRITFYETGEVSCRRA